MTPREQILVLYLLGLTPISLFLMRWVFFVLGKISLNILMRGLDRRSKLYHEIIEIYRRTENNINLVFILVGFLLFWFLIAIANFFI